MPDTTTDEWRGADALDERLLARKVARGEFPKETWPYELRADGEKPTKSPVNGARCARLWFERSSSKSSTGTKAVWSSKADGENAENMMFQGSYGDRKMLMLGTKGHLTHQKSNITFLRSTADSKEVPPLHLSMKFKCIYGDTLQELFGITAWLTSMQIVHVFHASPHFTTSYLQQFAKLCS